MRIEARLGRIGREHPGWVDAAVVAVALVISSASLWYVATLVPLPVALLLNLVPPVALIWRRSAPGWMLGVVLGCDLLQWALAVTSNLVQTSTLIALYSVAHYAPRRVARTALAGVLAVVLIAPLRQPYSGVGNLLLWAGLAVLAHLLGTNVALRRSYLRALEEKAERLERERDAAAEVAAAQERTRIARELHDVVAHHVSVMVVQAEGAGWAIDDRPEQARAAVATIARTGRSTLVELRRLLGVLRSEQSDGMAPQPGLADLPALVEGFRASGLTVVLHEGPSDVPETLQLAVFRIVQEGLTNVLKHAGPSARVEVTVREPSGSAALMVEIKDDGRGPVPASNDRPVGHGLIGMRERVALFDGVIETGPQPGRGFVVRATLPFRAGEPG